MCQHRRCRNSSVEICPARPTSRIERVGWIHLLLLTDCNSLDSDISTESAEVGMLNLGLRCAFRWNYPWTTTQEEPDGNLEKCRIPMSAWSGEHRSSSESWGGMWTDTLGWISLRWWICPVTCALLWDRRSDFRHTFNFKVHKVAKKNKVQRKCAAMEDLKQLGLFWWEALWDGLVMADETSS